MIGHISSSDSGCAGRQVRVDCLIQNPLWPSHRSKSGNKYNFDDGQVETITEGGSGDGTEGLGSS